MKCTRVVFSFTLPLQSYTNMMHIHVLGHKINTVSYTYISVVMKDLVPISTWVMVFCGAWWLNPASKFCCISDFYRVNFIAITNLFFFLKTQQIQTKIENPRIMLKKCVLKIYFFVFFFNNIFLFPDLITIYWFHSTKYQ